jgi:hypothetical protein
MPSDSAPAPSGYGPGVPTRVDYSIKAYSLASIESCSNVQSKTLEINIHHLEIAEISREILDVTVARR